MSSRVGPAPRCLCFLCDAMQPVHTCTVQGGVVTMAGMCLWAFLQGGKCLAELEPVSSFPGEEVEEGPLSGQMCWRKK